MPRLSKEEQKRRHLTELNTARVRRFLDKHPMKHFDVMLRQERYDQIDYALKQDGITKKSFLENAIEKYLVERARMTNKTK